ncbi:hypothetical protein ACFPTO_03560 [Paraburkholderia denitrificans]|uniref:Integrase catalytic domain-containing protein n=1 Tax=Paraburkholderia denitrificans TaxID=694025 RepID=A0ABW0J4C3_9BURK
MKKGFAEQQILAGVIVAPWHRGHNEHRPHRALSYLSPVEGMANHRATAATHVRCEINPLNCLLEWIVQMQLSLMAARI